MLVLVACFVTTLGFSKTDYRQENLGGHVAELVYAYVSEAYGETRGSSSLPMPTKSALCV